LPEGIELQNLAPTELMSLFPEAKLTIRDRLPTNMLLLYTFLNINKALKDIKVSAEEIGESILGLVAMIPDELRDDQFIEELNNANEEIIIDNRPQYCGVKASEKYCKRMGIEPYLISTRLNYFEMYHAVFNLLMRKHMLLKIQPKEIMTGIPFEKEEDELDPEIDHTLGSYSEEEIGVFKALAEMGAETCGKP
jgi:hypothetical protein